MAIGIIDREEKDFRISNIDRPNVLVYIGNDRAVYGDAKRYLKHEGNGFREKDIITVSVDLQIGRI